MKVGIARERAPGELRCPVSPETVRRYAGMGIEVAVERGAGEGAAFSDDALKNAGASLVDGLEEVYGADLILKVQAPVEEERGHLREGQFLVGMLDPYNNREALGALAEKKVTAFALELLPRTTRAQAMDVLSSQANLAGYRAVIEAMAVYPRAMPMMMTAAGTVTPAKVFIVGAGVAGLQAIATARRMGAVVSATDVRPAAREEVESLGAKFVGVTVGGGEGGYARALTEDEQKEQAKMVADHIKGQDIVITTAQIPGRKAPRIVSHDMLKTMKPGSVVFDLAAESGGNVEGAKPGETVEPISGLKLIGAANMGSKLAPATSVLYAKNLANFLQLLVDSENKRFTVNLEDDLVKGTLVTQDGAIVHDRLKQAA